MSTAATVPDLSTMVRSREGADVSKKDPKEPSLVLVAVKVKPELLERVESYVDRSKKRTRFGSGITRSEVLRHAIEIGMAALEAEEEPK
jgi:hypothetical protein